ncbi:hypothetical protein HY994_00320 [Candidatus Micrarchaeota archaeon]|nr:hypothetical protein [Candidatus Micrarchaeota archaeon]
MTIAEEVESVWAGVQLKPKKGVEKAYYADLLRRVMVSKKQLEETGRKYSILPDLRELTRRTMVRIPAEHVEYLEISVFDLISNPLKKNLQPFVSEFKTSGDDLELVLWFVRHAKKEPSLALDFKALQSWLDEQTMPSDSSASSGKESAALVAPVAVSAAPNSASFPSPVSDATTATDASSSSLPAPPSSAAEVASDSSSKSSDSSSSDSESFSTSSAESSSSSSLQTDTSVPTPPMSESDGTNADRIFEHD